jgi:hypothetical protein
MGEMSPESNGEVAGAKKCRARWLTLNSKAVSQHCLTFYSMGTTGHGVEASSVLIWLASCF